MMAKFRKRPVVIEAVQLRWDTWSEMCGFADVGRLTDGKSEGCYLDADGSPIPAVGNSEMWLRRPMGLLIPTLEGLMVARQDDWIIRGVKGEFYPCKNEIFLATYEPAEDEAVRDVWQEEAP